MGIQESLSLPRRFESATVPIGHGAATVPVFDI